METQTQIKSNESGGALPSNSPLLDFTKLPIKRRFAIITQALESRELGESLSDVAARAGVSRQTLHRYMSDREFLEYYNSEIASELQSSRKRTIKTLIEGANTSGAGQPALMKMLFTMTGDYREKVDVNVDVNSQPVPLDTLPLSVKMLLAFTLKGGKLPEQLNQALLDFCQEALIEHNEVRPEYKLIDSGEELEDGEEDKEEENTNTDLENGKDKEPISDFIDADLINELLGE